MGLCDGRTSTWVVVKEKARKWARYGITDLDTDSYIMGNYRDEASARKSLRKIVRNYLNEESIYDGWIRESLIDDQDFVCIIEYHPSIYKLGFSAPKVEHRIGLVIFSITRIF